MEGSPKPAAAPPPPPGPPPAAEDDSQKTEGQSQEQTQQEETASSAGGKKKVAYSVFTGTTIKVGSAADRKASAEELAKLAPESGELVVLVRVGQAEASEPKKALAELGQVRQLDGDYEVIADSSRNEYKGVKTAQRVEVTFG